MKSVMLAQTKIGRNVFPLLDADGLYDYGLSMLSPGHGQGSRSCYVSCSFIFSSAIYHTMLVKRNTTLNRNIFVSLRDKVGQL